MELGHCVGFKLRLAKVRIKPLSVSESKIVDFGEEASSRGREMRRDHRRFITEPSRRRREGVEREDRVVERERRDVREKGTGSVVWTTRVQ